MFINESAILDDVSMNTFSFVPKWATVGMFDWRLFDNSNRTSYVRQPSKVGMFDLDYVRHGAAIVEHNINRTLTGT
jgi:hypothetical protein